MWPFATALLASLGRVPMAGPTAVPLAVRIAPPRPRSRPPLALAPSGIDALDLPAQAAVFAGCYGALGVGTLLNVKLFDVIGEAVSADTQENLARAGSLLGILFIGAGITHFTNAAAYEAIFPPLGTWGLWYLPGDADFHVKWTGAAEIAGGTGLLLGAILDALGFDLGGRSRPLRLLCASALFLLTLCVTPANIYMYTHGAMMEGLGPDTGAPLPVEFHYLRLGMQVLILSILWKNRGRGISG